MFGTIARLKVKPGQEAALQETQDQWWRERKPKAKGAITAYVCKPVDGAADEQILFVVFDSKENYVANANDPEQDAWYQNFRACLTADPEWTDVEITEAKKG